MVLTNFELWAADGSSALNRPLELETSAHNRHLNPFDPRAVPAQLNSNVTQHLSSNGYYGFSYVNAAHNDIEDSINNNNNNNINTNNNNNNTSTYNFMANDVNGMSMTTMTTTTPQTHAVSANNSDSDCAVNAAGHAANVTRCKKRFFVMNDADDCTASNNKNHNGSDIFAKRCRFDDDFAAQYCNDFFSMPSTQIATQSCLMDTEEVIQTQPQQQQQYFPPIQQQVDEAMFDNNNNNTEKYELNSHLQLQHEQQQQQSQMQTATTTAQLTPQPPTTQHQQLAAQSSPQQQHLYHQQQHYQGHLHRSNRDVSRCMLSHMI